MPHWLTDSQRCFVKKYQRSIAAGLALLLGACSTTVPKEVVELSYKMEQDMVHVEQAYIELVHQHVAVLKKQREDYLYNEWAPVLLEDWIKNGQLIQMAQGQVVYDNEVDDFVAVSTPDRLSQLKSITEWALVASEEIEAKRRELITPLEEAEEQLISDIRQSFTRLVYSNQTITAHLNSLREVQSVQNELLASAGFEDLRDQINQKLSDLSVQANTGLETVRELDEKVQPHMEKLQ